MNKRCEDFRKLVILGISIALLTAGGLAWYHKTWPWTYHFLTVKPGVLYRSGWMSPDNQERIIRKYGIKTVVNLCLTNEDTYLKNYVDEQHICQKNGVKLVNLPLQGKNPPSKEQTAEWLNLLSNDKKLPILVHCAQGVTRTGVMVAIYEMEFLGKDNKETLEGLPRFGHRLNSPKHKKIRDFILNYKPRIKDS